MITIEQMRAARGLLGWSQSELAKRAGLSLPTVKRVEAGSGPRVSDEARRRIQQALEMGGAQFIAENGGGPGVRLRKRPRPSRAWLASRWHAPYQSWEVGTRELWAICGLRVAVTFWSVAIPTAVLGWIWCCVGPWRIIDCEHLWRAHRWNDAARTIGVNAVAWCAIFGRALCQWRATPGRRGCVTSEGADDASAPPQFVGKW